MKRCSAVILGFGLATWAATVSAEPEPLCSGRRPWVAVGGSLPSALAAAVRSDLRAGLTPGEIDVCEVGAASSPAPLARVQLVVVDEASAKFSIDVVDSVTQKRVGRDLGLSGLPEDGRALALAVAAEELLRASWAELALRGVRTAQSAPPPEVRAMVEQATTRKTPARPAPALGARFAFERFLGGQTHFGADLVGTLPVSQGFGGILALGARRSLSVAAPNGEIVATVLASELGLSLSLLRGSAAELSALTSARVLRLRFEAEAEDGATSTVRSGWGVFSRWGLGLSLGPAGGLRSYSAFGVGLPLKAFSVADTGTVVTGASRLELFASSGLALELK